MNEFLLICSLAANVLILALVIRGFRGVFEWLRAIHNAQFLREVEVGDTGKLPIEQNDHRWTADYSSLTDAATVEFLDTKRCCNFAVTVSENIVCADCGHLDTCGKADDSCLAV